MFLATVVHLNRRVLAVVLLTEFTWAFLSASKAPIMATLLFVIMRIFIRGESVRVGAATAYGALGLTMFLLVQDLKNQIGLVSSVDKVAARYPALVEFLYPVLARFDALKANTDALLVPAYSYLSASEVVNRIWQAPIPRQLLGTKFQSAGTLWGTDIRPQAGLSQSSASLAEGPVAEGWVLAGWLGIGIEIMVLAAVIILVARLYQSRTTFGIALGVAMTAHPYIFERGALGISEGIGKSLQLAVLATLALMLLNGSKKATLAKQQLAIGRM
jgi:hypothetical protein